MKIFTIEKEMNIFCVRAKSFPYEIKQAFSTLVSLLPTPEGRTFFGIAYQDEEGMMVYKAAVLESFKGEAEKLGCEKFRIEKGDYLTETLRNWKKDETMIGTTFKKISESNYPTTFPCVEWYRGNNVMCMVKLLERSKSKTKNT